MARSRARDYEDKRAAILSAAARAFADGGYDRTSMASLATICGVSKALLYHYYASKEALLFDIIRSHLEHLIDVVETAGAQTASPRDRLRNLVGALLDAYRDADAEHSVQIDALSTLSAADQEALRALERRLVGLFADAVAAVAPALGAAPGRLKPAVMSLFGMLNWAYMWFRDDGPMSREAYADMATALFLDGVAAAAEPRV